MRAAKSSRRFWAVTALGAVAFAVLWAAVVSPARDLARSERESSTRLAAAIERHFSPEGEPLGSVERALASEKDALAALRSDLGAIGMEIPAEYQGGPDRDPLYFQKQLSEFRQWVRESGVAFGNAAAPLGFRENVSADMVSESLARLAVAKAFVETVGRTGVKAILRARQLAVPSFRSRGAAQGLVEELPFKVTLAADEEGLVRLVQESSRPGNFFSVKGLLVEVRQPDSGVFEATLDLAGVRLLQPPEPEAGEAEELKELEAEAEPGPGVLVPTVPPVPGKPSRAW